MDPTFSDCIPKVNKCASHDVFTLTLHELICPVVIFKSECKTDQMIINSDVQNQSESESEYFITPQGK